MHILPELEEEVLISFEGGCAEKPVVIGTMFHGSGKSGHGGAGNYMKGLQTVAGQRLQMNDQDGSMYLQDNGGNSLQFDGAGNSNKKVDSNDTENVGAKKTINVGEGGEATLNMDSGGNVEINANSQLTITVGAASITLKKDGSILINGKDMGIGVEKAQVIASTSAHYNSGETKIDGGNVFIN